MVRHPVLKSVLVSHSVARVFKSDAVMHSAFLTGYRSRAQCKGKINVSCVFRWPHLACVIRYEAIPGQQKVVEMTSFISDYRPQSRYLLDIYEVSLNIFKTLSQLLKQKSPVGVRSCPTSGRKKTSTMSVSAAPVCFFVDSAKVLLCEEVDPAPGQPYSYIPKGCPASGIFS